MFKAGCVAVMLGVGIIAGGCTSGNNRLNPNPEKSFQKKPRQLTAYASERAYPAEATKAEKSPIVAEVDYGIDVINLVNLGTEDWQDVDVWVNQQYVVKLASLRVGVQRGINFRLLYDNAGHQAPSKGVWIKTVEIERGGELYPVRLKIAD